MLFASVLDASLVAATNSLLEIRREGCVFGLRFQRASVHHGGEGKVVGISTVNGARSRV